MKAIETPMPHAWLYDAFGSYFWLFIGSFGIGLGAIAIAFTFRPPRQLPAVLPSPSVEHLRHRTGQGRGRVGAARGEVA